MKIKANQLIIPSLILIIIGILSTIKANNIWAALILVLYVGIFAYCTGNIDKHIILLMFCGCYFVFLVGGIIVKEYFDFKMSFSYSDDDYNFMLIVIFLSLISVCIGYVFTEHIRFTNTKQSKNRLSSSLAASEGENNRLNSVRKITLCAQYVFLVFYILVLAEAIMVVRAFGYSEYYSYESNLPNFVTAGADYYILALFMFLSTLPGKKQAKVPLLIFFLLNCASILTGRRMFFVVDNMIIICYLFFRNKLTPENQWIKRKHIFIIILILPFILVFLYTYNYIRFDRVSKAQTAWEAFLSFFKQQGFSANLIPLGRIYAAWLKNDIYSLYDILQYLRLNPIVRFLTNSSYRALYSGSRENLALYSGSFARAISYAVVKNRYLAGYGMGSCYIAELYHDFSYIGIFAGNFIYGVTMAKTNKLERNKTVRNMLVLLMIRGFFKSPRYCFDSPYCMFFQIDTWAFIVLVYGLAFLMTRSSRNKRYADNQNMLN